MTYRGQNLREVTQKSIISFSLTVHMEHRGKSPSSTPWCHKHVKVTLALSLSPCIISSMTYSSLQCFNLYAFNPKEEFYLLLLIYS
jgi:hypothetical protein